MRCLLMGSEMYCKSGHRRCCASCEDRAACDKACLNDPSRCGCATAEPEAPASQMLPVPRSWRGGGEHGR